MANGMDPKFFGDTPTKPVIADSTVSGVLTCKHGLLRGRVAVIELERVRPARKVGIATVREHEVSLRAFG